MKIETQRCVTIHLEMTGEEAAGVLGDLTQLCRTYQSDIGNTMKERFPHLTKLQAFLDTERRQLSE